MKRVFMTLALCVLPGGLLAQDFSALEQPGAMALMRHALAPGTGDPASFDIDDCSTQRNLSTAGRAQSERIGAALRNAGITFDHVWTSRWCRCFETAELMDLGPVERLDSLNSFFRDRARAQAQSAETIARIAALEDGARAMMVTHQVNVTALTNVSPQSGEIIVVRLTEDGGLEVLDQILIAP